MDTSMWEKFLAWSSGLDILIGGIVSFPVGVGVSGFKDLELIIILSTSYRLSFYSERHLLLVSLLDYSPLQSDSQWSWSLIAF